MRTDLFDFELPGRLIALAPAEPRDAARLLCVSSPAAFADRRVLDLPELLAPGDAFQASEWHRNVHWFAAESGPAIVWNFNARGYETTTFDPDDGGPFGRRYLDPRTYGVDGLVIAEELDAEAAEARFQGRPLTADPVPAEIVRTDRGAKVRLA